LNVIIINSARSLKPL